MKILMFLIYCTELVSSEGKEKEKGLVLVVM